MEEDNNNHRVITIPADNRLVVVPEIITRDPEMDAEERAENASHFKTLMSKFAIHIAQNHPPGSISGLRKPAKKVSFI